MAGSRQEGEGQAPNGQGYPFSSMGGGGSLSCFWPPYPPTHLFHQSPRAGSWALEVKQVVETPLGPRHANLWYHCVSAEPLANVQLPLQSQFPFLKMGGWMQVLFSLWPSEEKDWKEP